MSMTMGKKKGGGGGGARAMLITKTPSQLRREQLKRTNVITMDHSPPPLLPSSRNNGQQLEGTIQKKKTKQGLFKNPRCIGGATRLDQLYPSKKSTFRMLSGKENINNQNSVCLNNLSNLAPNKKDQGFSEANSLESTHQTFEKCSQTTFRSVTQLSAAADKLSGLSTVDMDKALKGLIACDRAFNKPLQSSESKFSSECHLPGKKAPLDLTLKTCMRLVSSSSMNWSAYDCMPQLSGFSDDHNIGSNLGSKALHSWVYPQSTLPPTLMSFLASSAADGVEMDFLRKRQLAWEDSFRSLYFMLRKNACDIFYVCTSQLVVMFTGGLGITKRCCNAYISQSTQSLRSLLKEHGICFSMPLCSKLEQVTTEDLVELSEMEKHNLGQTRRLSSSSSDIDNTPQSLLAFSGNSSIHGLFDFLLNYRSLLTFSSAVDVPALYSPFPFQNAALSTPEVKCTEMKRADRSYHKGPTEDVSSSLSFSIEIKDAYIPPWIISSVCAVMGFEDRSFEASFTTVHTSVGLNAALRPDSENTDKELQVTDHAFGINGATVAPFSCSGFLKSLKYCSGSYEASLSPF